MGQTSNHLEALRERHKAGPTVLAAARARRDAVLTAVKSYPGWLRDFTSGSIAHQTVNDPVVDADCGMVLDRRSHPPLGPDGDGVGPFAVVHGVAETVALCIREAYPLATIRVTKRAIEVSFHHPLAVAGSPLREQDPSVDLIVALTRADAPGLWIPNTEANDWDASDPEKHTELFQEGDDELRRVRRRAIRLSKLYQRQFGDPVVISSFNQEAIGHAAVGDGIDLGTALWAICNRGAEELAAGLTADPAKVSDPIKCPDQLTASSRYRTAADHLARALAHDDDAEYVKAEIGAMYAKLEPAGANAKATLAAAVSTGMTSFGAAGLGAAAGSVGVRLKHARAYGDRLAP